MRAEGLSLVSPVSRRLLVKSSKEESSGRSRFRPAIVEL